KSIVVVAAVIAQDGRYLVTQRRASAVLPLLWEFPGGKVEPGETVVEALKREVKHRVGVEILPGAQISSVAHAYEHYTVELHLYDCRITLGEPAAVNVQQFRWVESAEFEDLPFTPADEASMSKLLGLIS
ncbi:MAG TPA: (deoxy)nucleoside triphosphate pyrophosphohydrolase, partial [Polyangiaceae bacterium]|nr:(deoxy)nucleoside triphosphate pyrophosphohydrolase [Polyangiaceae bacterium]